MFLSRLCFVAYSQLLNGHFIMFQILIGAQHSTQYSMFSIEAWHGWSLDMSSQHSSALPTWSTFIFKWSDSDENGSLWRRNSELRWSSAKIRMLARASVCVRAEDGRAMHGIYTVKAFFFGQILPSLDKFWRLTKNTGGRLTCSPDGGPLEPTGDQVMTRWDHGAAIGRWSPLSCASSGPAAGR